MSQWSEFWLIAFIGIVVYVIIALIVIAGFWACGMACACANRGVHSLLDDSTQSLLDDDEAALMEKTFDVAP